MQQGSDEKKNMSKASGRSLPVRKQPAGKPAKPVRQRWELTHKLIVIRGKGAMAVMLVLLFALCCRFAVLQLADPHNYAEAAVDQYTHQVTLEAKRGTIFASDGTTKLAVSATTQTVFISPYDVYKLGTTDTESAPAEGEKELLRRIAYGLADCLDNYEAQTLIDKYEKLGEGRLRYKYLVVKKDISEEEEARVRYFISQNGLERQVALEEGTKRYYPYSTLASQLIGFVGADNTGLSGIEYFYNESLSGIDGKAVRAQDANGNQLAYNYEKYIEAQDGLNLVTTIDWNIQSIVERHIEDTYLEHEPQGRVSCIVMDVKTGEILAMAIYPSYDLNHYATLSAPYQAKLDAYEGEDKETYLSTLRNEMWNNTIVTQTYEPGSTFKIATAAMALESGSITRTQTFSCDLAYEVAGTTIHCWTKVNNHGAQTVKDALIHSCNPAFAKIGLAIGQEKFKKYFQEFGYTAKTGVDLPGEVSSIYYETTGARMGDVELAVYAFGQTFKITMLQHIAALSSVANGGYLVTPHIGKYLTDQNGNIVKSFSNDPVRQVVSADVSKDIMSYLVNSTKNGCVNGYNVVLKTGTSEKRDTPDEEDYIGSCVAFAPAEDPQVAVLLTVDTPKNEFGYYGSQVAAPAISGILTEVLPYLGIAPDQTSNPDANQTVAVSNYKNVNKDEAKAAIEALGLKCVIKGEGETVLEQMPRAEQRIAPGGTVILYTESGQTQETVSVPNVKQSTPEAAISSLQAKGLNVRLEGIYMDTIDCYVDTQSIDPNTKVAPGTVIVLQCRYKHEND